MILIKSLVRKAHCLGLSAPKRPKFGEPLHFLRDHEAALTLTRRTVVYECLYDVQYTSHASYTRCAIGPVPGPPDRSIRLTSALNHSSRHFSSSCATPNSESAGSTADSPSSYTTVLPEPKRNDAEVSYEEYWGEDAIAEARAANPDLFVTGTVYVPAFATSDSRLVIEGSEATETNGHTQNQTPTDDPGPRKKSQKELKIYGFISRNRAFHGDRVVALKARRQKSPQSGLTLRETPGECRVIGVLKRSPRLASFVATVNASEFFDDAATHIRCQPRDSRWPAFKVDKAGIGPEVAETLRASRPDQRLMCMCSFEGWDANEIEPRGGLTRVIGDVGEATAQMEATMWFHGLDSSGFAPEVMQNLAELIEAGNRTRGENREDMNHLFVLSIDPKDAKDLDDALSVERLSNDRGETRYRVGIHVADVSHYVREGSAVDADARSRATSVYMEHRVYPMLPRELSEDLCSLLPHGERLCFSVFVELAEAGEGEKVGLDLYVQSVAFKLTTITSKNRLTYENAKTLLYSCLNARKGREVDLGGHTFERLEALIAELGVADETKLALLRLYFLAQKLRFYRQKQLGAVHVDIDGSIRCHIPQVAADPAREAAAAYLTPKGRLDRRHLLRIEKIPRESHELIEEMMLLANTQVARFLSEKFELYFLRVHRDTSKAVKSLIEQVLPRHLRSLIDVDSLSVTELLSKCEQYMDPAAFQSLSFSALQKFKEAIYSPIGKGYGFEEDYTGHWGLALPVYLHFTSPIRRYPDLHTHRMLKALLFEGARAASVDELTQMCQRCNLQKRRAFDAQKEYRNFAFNKYLQFVAFVAPALDPAYLRTLSISRAFTKEAEAEGGEADVWGYLYADACVANIVFSGPAAGKNGREPEGMGKTSLVFYIPLLNEQRSVSCDALNIEPISTHVEKARKRKQVKSSILKSYYQRAETDEKPEAQHAKVRGLSAMMRDKRMEFYVYQKARVLLVPGSKMWTVRLPVDYLK